MDERQYGDADDRLELSSLTRGVRTLLEEMQESGLDELPLPQFALSTEPSAVLDAAAPETIIPLPNPPPASGGRAVALTISSVEAPPPTEELDPHAEFFELTRGVRALLEEMRESGLDELPLPHFTLSTEPSAAAAAPETAITLPSLRGEGEASTPLPNPPPASGGMAAMSAISSVEAPPAASSEADTLEAIQRDLEGCTRCPLHENRRNIVFGRGNPQAPLVLVGEAPGRDEDIKGLPFVGEAGRLLDNILRAMELTREDVYICNVCKCRPPGNRDPAPEEMAVCQSFLKRQLAVIHPRLLVTLGRIAAQTLLNARTPISRLRGVWREYEGIPLMPTYHPAYLLRNPGGKKEVWEDMKQVLRKLRE